MKNGTGTMRLPNSLSSYVRTGGIVPGGVDLTVKVTVWLMPNGLPNSKWRYKLRSQEFQCPLGDGGMLPPVGQAPPSVGGGDTF